MPLSPPLLDDRRYDDLFGELRRRIPVYNPAWTDYNDSDPGITLLQLFAFMTEGTLFRLNQIPEATQLTFLRLLDIALRPATPARCLLGFQTPRATGEIVPAGAMARAGKLPFRLEGDSDIPVWPVEALAVARQITAAPVASEDATAGSADDPELYDVLQARLAELAQQEIIGSDAAEPAYYQPVSLRQGETGQLSFADTVDQTLWIALLCQTPGVVPVFGAAGQGGLSLAFGRAEPEAAGSAAVSCTATSATGGDLIFEMAVPSSAPGGVQYHRLVIASDTTAGLSRSGIIRLTLPGTASGTRGIEVGDLLEGVGDLPPPLAEEDRTRVWIWLRLRLRNGPPPDLAFIAVNAGQAVQASKAAPEYLGTGTGQPGQVFALAQRPVISRDDSMPVVIEVEEAGIWQRWSEIESLDLAGEDDRVFSLDREAGEVRFGAGGPALGARVRALSYFYGGGAASNVPAGAVAQLEGVAGALRVTNITPGSGGSDAETLDEGLTRIPAELRRRDRAVTSGDFRELALLTPGAGIGRAECLPRYNPHGRAWNQPGIVSVMVWPGQMPADGTAPVPSRNSLDQVCRQLSSRRLVTTELYVLPPEYVSIAISTRIAVEPGYSVVAVTRWVEQILRQFLSPLPPHGPEGGGWPLGRLVNPRELEATVLQVEGVDYVEALRLARREGTAWIVADTVALQAQQVPWLTHIVAVGPGATLPEPGTTAPPPAGPTPVPIPVIREVC